MKEIKFRMVAYTDPAGKYVEGVPGNGNEDNFYVDDNLGDNQPGKMTPDKIDTLSDCGCLMVVADGMGGMNAGEVASKIAIDTVTDFFAPGKITPEMAKSHASRRKYLEATIVEADRRIKQSAKENPEQSGMGSTIIMAWIVGGDLSLSWCGDSRAYRYNKAGGIEPLSKDHSYVQTLVDKGIITYDDAFDHPQGNIVVNSLGDSGKKAVPESRLFKVYNGDIILLCSDGLSGVLRDKKTYINGQLVPGDTLEDIIANNSNTLKECREALWVAAEKADWYDNVTAVLCEIVAGAEPYPEQSEKAATNINNSGIVNIKLGKKGLTYVIAALLLIIGVTAGLTWKLFVHNTANNTENVKDGEADSDPVTGAAKNIDPKVLTRRAELITELGKYNFDEERRKYYLAAIESATDLVTLDEIANNIRTAGKMQIVSGAALGGSKQPAAGGGQQAGRGNEPTGTNATPGANGLKPASDTPSASPSGNRGGSSSNGNGKNTESSGKGSKSGSQTPESSSDKGGSTAESSNGGAASAGNAGQKPQLEEVKKDK